MKKTELISALAQTTGESQAAAAKHLDAFIDVVTKQLAAGDEVNITGFGNFKVAKLAARTGRNPRTGESMPIAASTAARFAPGAKLKAALNGGSAPEGEEGDQE